MLSGVSVICFAASYAVALALELTRLLFRSGLRGAVMLGFAAAGLLAHTLFLYYRATNAAGSPLSSKQDWYLVAAWVLAGVYLYLAAYHQKTAFGVFLLPLVLGLIGVGYFLADSTPFPQQPAMEVWGIIHAVSLSLACVSLSVGFVAGLMYLGQERRLKHKVPPPRGLRLPSLEWLQRANSHAIVTSLLFLGVGILAGMVLNLLRLEPGVARLPWHDPFVLTTLGVFLWLLIAAGIVVFYRPARAGRKVAYLTLVSFVFLVLALAVGLSGQTRHGEGLDSLQGSVFRVQERVAGGWWLVAGEAGRIRTLPTSHQPLAPPWIAPEDLA
jgi:ABC-type uncharacterized transport system permease subunit